MNNIKNIQLKIYWAFLCLLVCQNNVWAQDAAALHGSLVMGVNGEAVYDQGVLSFNTVSLTDGFTIGTDRQSTSYLGFMGSASWQGASATSYVDGYVRSFKSGAFLFPVGDNGVFRPIAISSASLVTPSEAAYYSIDPSLAITSSIFGGSEPALPLGAPFARSSRKETIKAIDATGYWHAKGTLSAKISLSWIPSTAMATFTENNLQNLTIVGWKAGQWEEIPSSVDLTSILGGTSTYSTGSITTNASIVPNDYVVYALASTVSPSRPGDTTIIVRNIDVILIGPAQVVDPNTNYSVAGPYHGAGSASIDSKNGVITFVPSPISFLGRDTIYRIKCVTVGGLIICDSTRIFIEGKPTRTTLRDTTPFNTAKLLADLPRINTGGKPHTTTTTSSAGSTVTVDANGKVNYVPSSNFSGTDTVRVIRCVGDICDIVTYIVVVNEPATFSIPNYFSPNGDGINDVWNLDFVLAKYPKTRALVYNRWGNIVWRSTGTYGLSTSGNNVWVGQSLGSKDGVPDGVYYYLLEMEDGFNTTKTGFIELMRQ